jgi:hypothetical protein
MPVPAKKNHVPLQNSPVDVNKTELVGTLCSQAIPQHTMHEISARKGTLRGH